uniref:Uncharacterized protein n=1 Tax=Ananas comosus var. bracteatus TaxID=296719 RepID=A0A6V7P2L9_ANACO|nr:unnamed protein product [Ananas comosus var. bracteatus]
MSRRGISKFYCGKSKSFTMLTDAPSSSTSAEGLAKPENAYTRKRKNLLAFSIMCNKPQYEESMSTEGSVAKRAASSSRSPFSPLARSSSGMSSSYSSEEEHEPNPQQLPPFTRMEELLLQLLLLRSLPRHPKHHPFP